MRAGLQMALGSVGLFLISALAGEMPHISADIGDLDIRPADPSLAPNAEIYADDKTLRDDFTGFQSDGSHFTIHYLYDRIAGTNGFAGTWDSTTEKAQPAELVIQPADGGALSFHNLAQGSTKLMRFDGKDYPVKDAKMPAGASSSARRMDDHTIEFTEKRNGKVSDTQHIQLSADGRVLTMTIQPASGRKPNVLVFERE